ncbi:MAG: methionine--tRNA ligase subunit beta [Candidatus Shapirobacteria bacterium]|jgi:methionyl-tRNA synthetase|nr:methionine--tRNA ligase subunit beta [Candidatus Shapirobacteria bacterium]
MDQIKYDDFSKVEFKVGEIKEAVEVEGSEKLLRLQVDFGEEKLRNVFSGIKKWYSPTDLIGKKTIFVTNIEVKKVMGELSEAMIFAAENNDEISILLLDKDLSVGSKVF